MTAPRPLRAFTYERESGLAYRVTRTSAATCDMIRVGPNHIAVSIFASVEEMMNRAVASGALVMDVDWLAEGGVTER